MGDSQNNSTFFSTFLQWVDSDAVSSESKTRRGIAWLRGIPFIVMHTACLLVFWVGFSPFALMFAAVLYLVRMFAVTGFYHRYFSHKAFKTSRFMQFVFALVGNSSAQRGPIWWAGHHRHHHQVADTDKDLHSPAQQGFLHSHVGWLLTHDNFRTRKELTGDLVKFPELRLINRFDTLVPTALAIGCYKLGSWLQRNRPGFATSGLQLLVWGFAVSTVALFHGTATINSLSHLFGSRRYATPDTSRNNPLLAAITLGEGWHNNHHHYAVSARQGFFWYEVDVTWILLKALEKLGLIWDLRPIPERIIEEGRKKQ